MKLYWTKEAQNNLLEIEDFVSKDNLNAAIKLIDMLISLAEDLIDYPRKGRIVPELSIEQLREILYKNYRIVYLIKKGSIDIITVFESHKLLDRGKLTNQIKSN